MTSISTAVRMLTAFISTKIAAILIGPPGVALVGQLQNFSSIVMAIATGGINTGVTKYVAEYKNSKNKVRLFISTALRINLFLSAIVGLLMIILSSYLSQKLFHTYDYQIVLIIFGFTIILYALNTLLLSILNGFKEFKKYVIINIVASLTGLIFSVSLIFLLGILGALISIVTYQSVVVVVTIIMLTKTEWFNISYFKFGFSKIALKKYLGYTLMVLVSAFTVPVASIIIRNYITTHLSLNDAGIWEGINQISAIVFMFINTTLITYYIPRLSELKEKKDLKKEIYTTAKLVLPITFIACALLFFLRDIVIKILFSSDFLLMRELFLFQMIGLFLKLASFLIATLMHAKAKTKEFVITEILFSAINVILAILFINIYGLVGVTIAFTINYLLYIITMIFIFRDIIFYKPATP
ncbi:MAG: O-antigen translocase [Candidatus Kapabacteria bacterium]|nr:O-antigen translocase [Candidatus Kapabacteria bacterium]